MQWRRYGVLSSQPVFASYKKARSGEDNRLRKEKRRNIEKNAVDKTGDNPKLFHKFIRN